MTTADHLDDEQLTALADGDGAPDEHAHLEGCERCRERADALASAAALVATPPPAPSDADRDVAVAAALRAAERPVVPMRRPARRRAPAWLAPVAAVVALLALIAVVVPRLDTGDSEDSAASRGRSAAESADEGAAGAATGGRDDALRSAAPGGADLGAVDEESELARRVDGALAAEAAADAEARATGAPSCEGSFRTLSPPLGPLRLRASVVWRGEPAEVVSDGARAVVLATGDCAPLATVDL
jgi:hypothetical protein